MAGPIIFDVDGVLADFQSGYIALAKTLGVEGVDNLKPNGSPWDFFWNPQVWDAIKQSETFWQQLRPLLEQETRQRMRSLELSRDVYFVTSRVGRRPREQTRAWLTKHRFSWFPHVVLTSRKGEFAKIVEASFLLDDKAGNAVYTQYESPQTVAVLLDRLYNQFPADNLGSKVRRVQTVDEFLDMVEKR